MPLSFLQYMADGITDTFSIPFPYLSKTHIQVKVNGVVDAGITFPTDATVKTSTIPVNGIIVEVRRVTINTSRLVDFSDGSLLGEGDLDKSAQQVFYIAQELLDTLAATLGLNAVLQWDAQNKRITNIADGIAGSDAATVGQIQSVSTGGLLPTGTGNGRKYLRQKIDESGLEYPTLVQTQTDLGLPAVSGNGTKYVRVNSSGTAYEARTKAEMQSDINLPVIIGSGGKYIRVNPGETIYEARNPSEIRTDIGVPKRNITAPPVYVTASSFTISAIYELDSAGIIYEKATSTTVDITVSGLNGLVTDETEQVDRWYYPYVISNGSTVGMILSSKNKAGGATITGLPAGYIVITQLPIAIRKDASGNFLPWRVGTGWPNRPNIEYVRASGGPPYRILNGGSATSTVTVGTGIIIPPISKLATMNIVASVTGNTGTTGYINIQETGAGGYWRLCATAMFISATGEYVLDINCIPNMPLNASQQFDYYNSVSGMYVYIDVFGYVVTEM